jgi:acyl carrier protein
MEEKVIEIIGKVLEVPNSTITLETEIGELDEWDSLRNVHIFSELEKFFSVKITQEMLADLENVTDIIDLIKSLKSE